MVYDMEKKILRSKRVRVQTHSRICNLMFENFVRGKLSEYDEAERLHRAYGAWIASVCERGLGTASAAAFEEAEPAGIEEFIEGAARVRAGFGRGDTLDIKRNDS